MPPNLIGQRAYVSKRTKGESLPGTHTMPGELPTVRIGSMAEELLRRAIVEAQRVLPSIRCYEQHRQASVTPPRPSRRAEEQSWASPSYARHGSQIRRPNA
jgi:hypothetical protein